MFFLPSKCLNVLAYPKEMNKCAIVLVTIFHCKAGIVIGSDVVLHICHQSACCSFLDVPHPKPSPHQTATSVFSLPLKYCFSCYFSFAPCRMALLWQVSATLWMNQPWEPRGLSASSHPASQWGVRWSWAPSPAPLRSKSLAAPPHNLYSKGQLDWDHGAQGAQRPDAPAHIPFLRLLSTSDRLWHVKTESTLNRRHLATAL